MIQRTKKYIKNLFNQNVPAKRIEWWPVALLCLAPWALLGPTVFVSALFIPFFLFTVLGFLLNLYLVPLLAFTFLVTIFLFLHIVYVAVSLRRYKDLGKGKVWFLVILVPFIGIVWQVIELGFMKRKENKHHKY